MSDEMSNKSLINIIAEMLNELSFCKIAGALTPDKESFCVVGKLTTHSDFSSNEDEEDDESEDKYAIQVTLVENNLKVAENNFCYNFKMFDIEKNYEEIKSPGKKSFIDFEELKVGIKEAVDNLSAM